jgi:hypothetical protein
MSAIIFSAVPTYINVHTEDIMLKHLETARLGMKILYTKMFTSYFCMEFVRNSFCSHNYLASHTRDMHRNTIRPLFKIIFKAVRTK